MQAPLEKRSAHKHCDYHESHGPHTEDFISLKYFIEDQIKRGNFNQYLSRKAPQRGESSGKKHVVNGVLRESYSPPSTLEPDNEVLNINIYPEQVIFFSNQDFEGIDPNHNEALVISPDVANNEVKRILVDNGCSVNILFKHAHGRMQLRSVRINDCSENLLYGFRHSMVLI